MRFLVTSKKKFSADLMHVKQKHERYNENGNAGINLMFI